MFDQEQVHVQECLFLLLLIIATSFCLFAFFTYHMCTCCSPGVCKCAHKLDQAGIATLIGASYFTGIALGYRCVPMLRRFYLVYSAVVVLLLSVPLAKPGLVTNMPRHFIICVAMGLVP